jgi:Mce-associated membrane protein
MSDETDGESVPVSGEAADAISGEAADAISGEAAEGDAVDSDADAVDGDALAVKPAKRRSGRKRPVKNRVSAREWISGNKRALATAAVATFVAAGAFAGATAGPYLMDRAAVATKLTIARTAADAINTLWSYTPEDMDKLPDRSARYLGGDFEDQYRKYVDAIAATNKQAKVTSSTKVVGAAVESLRPEANEATAIVYTNTTSTSPQSNNIPSLKYLSYRLELKRYGRDWRVTKMTTVTSLDLTPKLGL